MYFYFGFLGLLHTCVYNVCAYIYVYINIYTHLITIVYFFLFYFIFKLYIIVLVLPNIKMNPPQVYMCSPS